MIKLTALWKNTKADGETYLSGTWGEAKVLVFSNKYKKESNHPDYIVYLAENKKQDGETQPPKKTPPNHATSLPQNDPEDDLPF